MFVFVINNTPPPNLNKEWNKTKQRKDNHIKHKESKLNKHSFTSWLPPDGQGKTTGP